MTYLRPRALGVLRTFTLFLAASGPVACERTPGAAAPDELASDGSTDDRSDDAPRVEDAPGLDVSVADARGPEDAPSIDAPAPAVDAVDVAAEPTIPPSSLGGQCSNPRDQGIPGTVCAYDCPPGLGWSRPYLDSPFCNVGRCCAPCGATLQPDGECLDATELECRRIGGRCGGTIGDPSPCAPGEVRAEAVGCVRGGTGYFVCCLPASSDAGADSGG